MTDPEPHRRRGRRRSSPLQRLTRTMGGGRGSSRTVLLVGALAILMVGAVAAFGIGTPTNGVAITAPSASPSSRPSLAPTLPAVPTPTASTRPSPPPTEIVARRIRIPRLGIDLQIIEGDGVDAPLGKAAHYPGSAWPDGGSNIYIYAHAQTGMFLTLWDAEVGDEVVLELADKTTRRYLVTEVKPRVRWNALEYLDPTPFEQLTLQTSTSYTATAPRFIVIAELAS